MTGNYLADTNVWVRMLRNDAQATQRFSKLPTVAFCAHVLGELYLGAYRSQQVQTNLTTLRRLLAKGKFILGDEETSRQYGETKQQLFAQGTPLPENDIWIAATALRHNLTLITYDAHFDAIPHLTKERW